MAPAKNPRVLGSVLALAAFVLVAYVPAIDGPFTFDDYVNIVFVPEAQPEDWTGLVDALGHPSRSDRPVARLTFGLNYLISGLDPSAYHATNIAIHAVASSVLFTLLFLLARAPRSPTSLANVALSFAFAGALVWAVHPANTQAVSYIVQRMASLAGLFYLATLCVFVSWRSRYLRAKVALPLVLVFWALALGSKLSAASAPAVCWLIEVTFFTGFTRRNLYLGASVLLGGLIAAGVVAHDHLRYFLTAPPRREYSGLERMLTQARVLWHYVSLLVWPDSDRLQVDYSYSISRSLTNPWSTLWGLTALVAVSLVAVAAIHRQSLLWPAFGWLFFLLGSSVESSFLLLDPIFEHRIYLPATLLVPSLIAPIFTLALSERAWTAVRLGVLLLAAILTWQTIERNRLWAEPGRLWERDLEGGAKPGRAKGNAVLAAMAKGNAQRASHYIGGDDKGSGRTGRGVAAARIALLEERYRAALGLAKQALTRTPRNPEAAYLYGLAALRLGQIDNARSMARQLQERLPDIAYTAVLQALIQHAGGAHDRAVEKLRSWLTANPDAALPTRHFVRIYLGNLLHAGGQTQQAIAQYRTVVQADPLNWPAWVNLAQIYRAAGEVARARTIENYLKERGVNVETLKRQAWSLSSSEQ